MTDKYKLLENCYNKTRNKENEKRRKQRNEKKKKKMKQTNENHKDLIYNFYNLL